MKHPTVCPACNQNIEVKEPNLRNMSEYRAEELMSTGFTHANSKCPKCAAKITAMFEVFDDDDNGEPRFELDHMEVRI